MSAQWQNFEKALYQWVLAGSGFDGNHVIFAWQSKRRPSTPYAEIRILNARPLGSTPNVSIHAGPNSTIERRVDRDYELQVQVAVIADDAMGGNSAYARACDVQMALEDSDIRAALRAAGLSPFDAGQVTNVPAVVAAGFEGRGVLTMRCYASATLSRFLGYIDSVNYQDLTGNDTMDI
jgi:hypothetical protein